MNRSPWFVTLLPRRPVRSPDATPPSGSAPGRGAGRPVRSPDATRTSGSGPGRYGERLDIERVHLTVAVQISGRAASHDGIQAEYLDDIHLAAQLASGKSGRKNTCVVARPASRTAADRGRLCRPGNI